jgi:hypothetical protein
MNQSTLSRVPLLGALCVAADLVSQEAIEECFRLQQTSYPGTPIGQILVVKGYLTQLELARMVAQQQHFRRLFCTTLDNRLGQTADAPLASAGEDTAARSALPELGAFTAAELDASLIFNTTA